MKKAVKGILIHNNRVLIGKERNGGIDGFKNGGWGIPGGHIEINEKETDALKREFFEETNLTIEPIRKIADQKIPDLNYEVHWYLCTTKSIDYKLGTDLEEIKFVPINKVLEECDERSINLWPEKIIDLFKNPNKILKISSKN